MAILSTLRNVPRSLLLLIAGLLPITDAQAVADTRSIRQMHHTAWTVNEGAPGQITALAQTRDGYLWLGTQTGLFRFDGVRFERYQPPAATPLPASSVASLHAPATGGLWIGFRYGAATFLRDDKLANYGEAQGLPTGTVFGFAQDSTGVTWAATFQGPVRLVGGRWLPLDTAARYPGKQSRTVFVDRAGTVWSATDTRLAFLRRGRKAFETLDMAVGRISQIAQAPDGAIWIAESDGTVRPVVLADGRPAIGPVVALPSSGLLFDRQGGLWATTLGEGIRRLLAPHALPVAGTSAATDEPEEFRQKDGLSSDYLTPLLEDREGNLWFGSNRGLDRIRRSKLLPAQFPEGAHDFALVAGDGGALWAGSRNRPLMRLAGENLEFSPLDVAITATHRDADGVVWLAGPRGVWRVDKGVPVFVTSLPADITYSGVQAITRDRDGSLWLSLNTPGLYRWAQGRWTWLHDDPRLSEAASPLSLLTDARGRLWMGFARNEITLKEGDDLRLVTARDGLQVGNVTALTQGRTQVWIGGERGLAYFDGKVFHAVTAAADDPFHGISGIVETANGDLWLNGARGIVHIGQAELARLRQDATHRVRFELLDFLDGLPGTPAQYRPIPTAVATTDGRLWFATTSGVVSVDPGRITRNPLPPPVHLQSLIVDGVKRDWTTGPPRLPAQAEDLQINYTALSLSIPERVRFRYKLEGRDAHWQDAGARRVAIYNNPGPGDYRFRVIAANDDGVWNEQGATLAFSIEPRFYQTTWFVLLCVLLAAWLLWLAYLLRLNQLGLHIRTRLHERHMERERIARELHDTLLQSIQGLILRFQAVAESIPASEPARAAMESALERADGVLVEGRDRVLDLRASTQYAGSLSDVFTQVADELGQGQAISFRVQTSGVEQVLDPIVRDELFRIGREALLNAYHHADAGTIEVAIDYSRDELRLRFIDDGRGVDAKVLERGGRPGHWGLSGMRERAERIGGKLSLWSRPGAGTEVELRLPAAAAYRPCLKASRWAWLRRWLQRKPAD